MKRTAVYIGYGVLGLLEGGIVSIVPLPINFLFLILWPFSIFCSISKEERTKHFLKIVVGIFTIIMAILLPVKHLDGCVGPMRYERMSLYALSLRLNADWAMNITSLDSGINTFLAFKIDQKVTRQEVLEKLAKDADCDLRIGYCGTGATLLFGAHPSFVTLHPRKIQTANTCTNRSKQVSSITGRQAINERLNQPITADWEAVELPQVASTLQDALGISVIVDPEIKNCVQTKLTLKVKDMPARNVLDWIVKLQKGLGFYVADDGLHFGKTMETQEINVRTGKWRISRGHKDAMTFEPLQNTAISKVLVEPVVANLECDEWQMVNLFTSDSPGVSPNFDFHGVLGQLECLERIFKTLGDDHERQREIARQVLTIWQKAGCCFDAEEHLYQIEKTLEKQNE
jgi:hypothetical protein